MPDSSAAEEIMEIYDLIALFAIIDNEEEVEIRGH